MGENLLTRQLNTSSLPMVLSIKQPVLTLLNKMESLKEKTDYSLKLPELLCLSLTPLPIFGLKLTKILNFQTPLQFFSQSLTILASLNLEPRIFGCSVFVHIPKHERTKFDPCSVKCVFVGYGCYKKGYRCYHHTTRRMYTTMDCTFLETEYFFSTQLSE